MKNKFIVAIVVLLFIVACGTTYLAYSIYQQEDAKKDSLTQDKGDMPSNFKEAERVKEEEGQRRLELAMTGGRVEKVENIPADQEKAILASFNEYIIAFNEKDLERYKKVISKNAEGFKYEEDIQSAENVFKQYDINREVQDVTIINYNESEAQVFSNLNTQTKGIETGEELASDGRQVTVFVKEDQWKVSSIYYEEKDNPKLKVNKQAVYDFMEEEFNSITNYGESYIPEIHDPMVAELAAEHFGITQEEADAMYIDVAMNMYK